MQAEHVHDDRIKLEKSDRVLESWSVMPEFHMKRLKLNIIL